MFILRYFQISHSRSHNNVPPRQLSSTPQVLRSLVKRSIELEKWELVSMAALYSPILHVGIVRRPFESVRLEFCFLFVVVSISAVFFVFLLHLNRMSLGGMFVTKLPIRQFQ